MLQSLSNLLSGDSRALPYLLAAAILVVVLGLLFALYRLVFAHRVRVPGTPRNRAPRLGVVDVYSLDGQRQLVIVRRDNVEHLLMIGGPNDVLIEPQILRGAVGGGNGREAAKAEPAPAEPLIAAAPRPVAPTSAPRRAPMRAVSSAPEPAAPATVDSAPSIAFPAEAPAPAAEPRLRPAPVRSESRPIEARFSESSRFVEANRLAESARFTESRIAEAKLAEPGRAPDIGRAEPFVDSKPAEAPPMRRPVVTPRPLAAASRPNLPSPITPLRPRTTPEPVPPVKPVPAEPVAKTPEPPAAPPPAAPLVAFEPPLAEPHPEPEPTPALIVAPPPGVTPEPAPEPERAPEPVEAPAAPVLEHAAPVVAEAAPPVEPPRSRTEETFYDLESLEAEMARLLGREG